MDEKDRQSAFFSALTTEHFVLQTAANGTISEAAARSSLYVFSLSSTLVAVGFTSGSREIFLPFLAVVLPVLFALGVFTVLRLVNTTLENMRYLTGIARIRAYYRTLTPEAAQFFTPETGRWPEAEPIDARFGPVFAFMSTAASMLALINSLVGGAGITMLAAELLGRDRKTLAILLGVAAVAVFMALFLVYERWRFQTVDPRSKELPPGNKKRS